MADRSRRARVQRRLLIFFLLLVVLAAPFTVPRVRTWLRPPPPPPPRPPAKPHKPPAPPLVEFTMFRGNPQRNLSAIGPVPRCPKIYWRLCTREKLEGKYEQRGDPKLTPGTPWRGLGWTGQPIRRGDRIYFGSSDSYVYCVQADTGEVNWYYPNHHCIKGSISLFGDYLYHGGRDNKIHCYDLNGRMVWETRTGNDMDSNPVVLGNHGLIGGEDKSIYSFDATTGRILWRMGSTDGSVESSPCVTGTCVCAGSDYGILYCCRIDTGKVVWKFNTQGDTDSTPVYWEGRIYVGSKTKVANERGHLWCVDAATGKAIWHVPLKRGIWATVALNPRRGRLYIGCNNGILYALNMADGGLAWKRKLGSRIWSSAAVTDGCILVGVRDGRLWCLDEETGIPIWVFDDGFDIDATPLVAGGLIVIGSQNGWVYGIGSAPDGEEISPHWFATAFPLRRRLDHNPRDIPTVANPAPPLGAYTDTSSRCRTNYEKPVYGPGYVARMPRVRETAVK